MTKHKGLSGFLPSVGNILFPRFLYLQNNKNILFSLHVLRETDKSWSVHVPPSFGFTL